VGFVKASDRQVLRWYPSAWRRRYGQELVALLEDTYGDQPLPLRCQLSLIHSGTRERVRAMRKGLNTYTSYSIACAAVWAVILAVVSTEAGDATRRTFSAGLRRMGDRMAFGHNRSSRLPATKTASAHRHLSI
jgi:hypothetical protein